MKTKKNVPFKEIIALFKEHFIKRYDENKNAENK